jgi:hypothetical protein
MIEIGDHIFLRPGPVIGFIDPQIDGRSEDAARYRERDDRSYADPEQDVDGREALRANKKSGRYRDCFICLNETEWPIVFKKSKRLLKQTLKNRTKFNIISADCTR